MMRLIALRVKRPELRRDGGLTRVASSVLSDGLQFLVDEHVTAEDAPAAAAKLVRTLIDAGWIAPEPNGDCVLGDVGYRPGPK